MLIPSFEEFEKKSVRAIKQHNESLVIAQKNAKDFADVTTQSQMKATKAYQKSATKLEKLSQKVAPGAKGTGLAALQSGRQLSPRQLGALKSQAARGVGIFKDMDAKIKASWIKTMNDMSRSHKQKVAKVKVGTDQIAFNYKVATAKMQIAWEKAMLKMKAAQSALVGAANKALGALGWISIAFLLFDLAKQGAKMLGLFGGEADEAATALGRLLANQKDLNDEIDDMLHARDLMMQSDKPAFEPLLEQAGKMLTSAALVDTMMVVQEAEKNARAEIARLEAAGKATRKVVDPKKVRHYQQYNATTSPTKVIDSAAINAQNAELAQAQKLRDELADRIEAIAKDQGFTNLEGVGAKLRDPTFTIDKLDEDVMSFIQTVMAAGKAIQDINNSRDKYNKELKDQLVGRPSKELQLQATLQTRLINLEAEYEGAKLKGIASDKDFLENLEEKIGKQKDLVEAQKAYVLALELTKDKELALKMKTSIGKSGAFGKTMAGGRERVRDKITAKDIEMAKINAQITKRNQMKQPMDGAELKGFLEKNRALERSVLLLGQQKDELEKSIDPLTQIEQAASTALETGMANAIMGVIDGTKSMKEGFLDMAKAVLQAIAQIIVKLIAMKAIESAAMAFGIPMAEGGVIPMAKGGIKPKGYRKGGVATEPTYLVGEGKHNEAVVPLPDGRSIPVVMTGGGGNTTVNVNIASDGQTTQSMTSDEGAQGAQLGRAISSAVQEEMHKQQRPGGILSPYGG
jgi:hypothetical protein